MFEGPKTIGRIGPPFAVGQFGGLRAFEAVAVGDGGFADARDDGCDLVRQPESRDARQTREASPTLGAEAATRKDLSKAAVGREA